MTEYSRTGMALGEMVGDAILRKSVESHLREGEEVLSVTGVRRKGGLVSKWTWNCLEVTPAGADLPKKMAVVATSRRLLILATGGVVDEAKALLVEVPRSDLGSVQLREGSLASEVTWSAQGRRYEVAAKPQEAKRLADALRECTR